MTYQECSKEELSSLLEKTQSAYEALKAKGMKLDMSRGKPSEEQLNFSNGMFDLFTSSTDFKDENGVDVRNYGNLDAMPEANRLFAGLLGVGEDEVIVGGSSSLTLMHDAISRAVTNGVLGGRPWGECKDRKWLCPVPGYDRHFDITEFFGFEMINIEMDENGPDIAKIEELVCSDPSIKGIWCVPQYSNPGGVTYSDEVVRRLAALKPAAPDFRIFWDNAYCVHDIYPEQKERVLDILSECKKAGNPNMVYLFGSTSKITFPGSGVGAMGASAENIRFIKSQMTVPVISWNKVNMLMHVRFFKDKAGIDAHMLRHAASVRPKFEAVENTLTRELGGKGIAQWSHPKGGYFVSVDLMDGCAKRTYTLCKEAGVALTDVGATYPYFNDPRDRNLRLAPTYPTLENLQAALDIFCVAAQLACLEKLLAQ